MPLFLYILTFCFFSTGLEAQMQNGLYGNEWIDYSQTYYRISVAADAWYRIPVQALRVAGLDNRAPSGFRLQAKGRDIPLYVHAPNGSVEYIEFYGEKNRGDLDSNVYFRPWHHFNPEYSLYNDTASYYLSWSAAGGGALISEQPTDLNNLPPKLDYYMHEEKQVYSSTWNPGKTYSIGGELLRKASFEYGEGYGSAQAREHTLSMPISELFATGPDAQLRLRYYAPAFGAHEPQLRIGSQTIYTGNYTVDSVAWAEGNLAASTLQSPSTTVSFRGNAGGNDQYRVSVLSCVYPRRFRFGNASVYRFLLPSSLQRQYLEVEQFAGGSGQSIYLYDLSNRRRQLCFWDGSNVRVDLPPSAQPREFVLVNTGDASAYRSVTSLVPVQMSNYAQQPADYIIIASRALRQSAQGGDPILEYAAYRAATGRNPLIVEVEELYEQFSYGVHSHPLALRNFAQYIKNTWPATGPEPHIFLIGKGRVYTAARASRPLDHLIPAFGSPPTDNLMFAPYNSDEPLYPVGRLAATSGEQVRLYLRKIQDMEGLRSLPQTVADRAWMKRILHLGGGSNSNEQAAIRSYLNNMKTLAQGPDYGANVQSFFKSSSSPIQAAQSASLDSLINSGVAMISFFGHSSANSFDFNLDYPERYNNYQRYPFIMALGCYGGTVYEATAAISERFVFEPEAGASVFLASVDAATLSSLGQFGNQIYQNLSPLNYGSTTGQLVKQSIGQLQGSFTYTFPMQMACQYMILHGDPLVDVQAQPAPDYYIDASLVSHAPAQVSTQLSEFDLILDIHNLGQALDTAFYVSVYRTYPNGQRNFVLRERMQAPHFRDSLVLSIPVDASRALGINYFDIYIDSEEEVDERPLPQAEQNNSVLSYPISIFSDDILPVYPYKYAIVPEQPITLKASTGNALAPLRSYVLQIDTTAYFNSPLLRQTQINQVGGLVEWTPNMSYLDSTVYYWRVSVDSLSPQQGYSWQASSFIYINGSYPGWNQSHFFQFAENRFQTMAIEEPGRDFNFISSVQELSLLSGFTPNPLHPERMASYLNGSLVDRCRCPSQSGVFVQVIDPSDLSFWSLRGQQSRYGAVNCDAATGRTGYNLLFLTGQSAGRQSLERFIQDTVPNGHYILFYSLNNAAPQLFDQSLLDLLEEQGAEHLNQWVQSQGQLPYASFFQKGDSSFIYKQSAIGAGPNSLVEISGLMPGNWVSGFVDWTEIGPVASWGSVHWRFASQEAQDQALLDIYGLDSSGQSQLLYQGLESLDTTLSGISVQDYPRLRLLWRSRDELNRSSPQLVYWRILADPLPEAALRPDRYYSFQSDTIAEGQALELAMLSQNISALDMDSMLIKFQVLGQSPVYQRLKPLLRGDTLLARIELESRGLDGPQQLFVELNPDGDQPEQYHFNNIALIPFFVNRDKLNPIMDVTFDGRHILNGDLVSAKPEIVVTLSDENRFLPLNKAEDFALILRHPSYPSGEIALDASTTPMQFQPATANDAANGRNKAQLFLQPELPFDGRYTLNVSSSDRSGNNSGALDYSVDFEVIRQASISNMLNYPNPFTTSTQFVFTITGSELPDDLRIQIFTVTGKLVREIDMAELGPLRIGLNRTEFAWDGSDQFGDRLANGVYLYKVIARKNGQAMEHYSGQQDQFFTKGFGKMYLMR